MATHAIVLRILATLASSLSIQDNTHGSSYANAVRPAVLECSVCLNHRKEPEGGVYELIRVHERRRRGLKTLSSSQSCLLGQVSLASRACVPKTESQAPPWNLCTFFHLRRGLSIGSTISMTAKENRINYAEDYYRNSPDREILTPEGCRILLQVGEKALVKLMEQGLPYVPTSNSYRFVRQCVIRWMANEAEKLVAREHDLSGTKGDR